MEGQGYARDLINRFLGKIFKKDIVISIYKFSRFGIVCILLALLGCSSYLSVDEVRDVMSGDDASSMIQKNRVVPGIVVNQVALYTANVQLDEGRRSRFEVKRPESQKRFVAVDQTRRLALNAHRLMFASGTLKVEVHENHLPKSVGITGQTGAVRAVDSANEAVKAQVERRQTRFDAKLAEEEAQEEALADAEADE